MKNKLIAGTILLLAVVIINSCEDKEGAAPAIAVNVPSGCDTAKLTYSSDSNTMQTIINVQCATNNTGCHSSGSISGYDFTSYTGIDAVYKDGLLYQALFGNGSSEPQMPQIQQAGWDQCILDKFKAWIARGCPK